MKTKTSSLDPGTIETLRSWADYVRRRDDSSPPELGYPKKSTFYRHGKEYEIIHVKRDVHVISDEKGMEIETAISKLSKNERRAIVIYFLYTNNSINKSKKLLRTSYFVADRIVYEAVRAFKRIYEPAEDRTCC